MAGRLFGSAVRALDHVGACREVQSAQGRPATKGSGVRAAPKALRARPAEPVRGRGVRMYGAGGLGAPAEDGAGGNPRASAFARAFEVEAKHL